MQKKSTKKFQRKNLFIEKSKKEVPQITERDENIQIDLDKNTDSKNIVDHNYNESFHNNPQCIILIYVFEI